MKTLGIFITSDQYQEYAAALARAARRQGLTVRMHFTGSGVRLIERPEFEQLAALAHHSSICRESAAWFQVEDRIQGPQTLPPFRQMAGIIRMCDRYLFI